MNWRWMSAAILGGTLGLYAGYKLTHAEPASYSLIPGGCTLDAAPHEERDGYFNCRAVSLSVPAASIPADILRQLLGQQVDIVVRVREPRVLDKVGR